MGKRLVIRDADFSADAIARTIEYEYVENTFTWGKGGIDIPGSSSGSTNSTMSMIGLPLAQNTGGKSLLLVAANGYKIRAYLYSTIPSPVYQSEYTFETYEPQLDSIIIPVGKYYQISVTKQDGTNADTTEGASALLIQQEVI